MINQELDAIAERLKSARRDAAPFTRRVERLEDELFKKACDIISDPPEEWMDNNNETGDYDPVLGRHACAPSPVNVCVYDQQSYTGHDQCVYCGQPEERK